jgi:hypothetical protein
MSNAATRLKAFGSAASPARSYVFDAAWIATRDSQLRRFTARGPSRGSMSPTVVGCAKSA